MTTINIETELRDWLVDNITNTIHGLETEDSNEFNEWAKGFERDEAEFVVDMEFLNDWGYETRDEISEEEASKYAQSLLQIILDNWYV